MSTERPTRHQPFESIYREGLEVVEERHEAVRLYPHSEQLPVLLRALRLEFHGGLPHRLARVDHRDDGFSKVIRRHAALMFCSIFNGARHDRVRLFDLIDANLVAQVSIVQQITVETRQGLLHRFRFYAGDDFVPEIFMSGKRLLFTDHVLQRFSARVPNAVGADLSNFLLTFFGTPHIALPVGSGRAFVVPYLGAILAFTYQETATEFIITTCLTVNEMHSLELELPPRVRHWLPTSWLLDHYKCWQHKTPLPPPAAPLKQRWSDVGHWIKDNMVKQGHGPGSQILFLDRIPGPCVLEIKPGYTEPRIDELDIYKQTRPGDDWDVIFAEREGQGSSAIA